MRKRSIYLLAFFLILSACSSSPKSTVEKMREEACNSDIQGFFSYVDKTQVAENMKKKMLKQKETGNEPQSLAQQMGKALVQVIMPGVMGQIWQAYEDEIKKGKGGNLCKMKIISEKTNTNENQVIVQFPDGKQQTWGFTKYDNKWMLISLSIPQ
jgi:hypothetical protein